MNGIVSLSSTTNRTVSHNRRPIYFGCFLVVILTTGIAYIWEDEISLFSTNAAATTKKQQSARWRNVSATSTELSVTQIANTSSILEGGILESSSTDASPLSALTLARDVSIVDHPDVAEPSQDSTVILMPPTPDPRSVYMTGRAFADDNDTSPFQYDEVSRNVSACPPTSQIKIDLTDWTFRTYGPDGNAKTIGGDEMYIYYNDGQGDQAITQQETSTTCISLTTDHGNGTYSLNFTMHPYWNESLSPLGTTTGTLHVWLEYSCSVGSIMRPFKDGWKTIGAIGSHWIAENVPKPATIHPFVPPNSDGAIDLGQIKSLMSAGDSVMQHFVSPVYNKYYWKNLSFGKNLRDCLLGRSFGTLLQLLKKRLKGFWKVHQNVGLIIGFAAWELQKPYGNSEAPLADQPYNDDVLFEEHLSVLRNLVNAVRQRFPGIRIFWKTGSYLHLHVVMRDKSDIWEQVGRIEYMSHHRTMLLYEKQKELMQSLNVTILDVMEGSYLMPDRARALGDAMHYDIGTNKKMLDWFYPNGLNESLWS